MFCVEIPNYNHRWEGGIGMNHTQVDDFAGFPSGFLMEAVQDGRPIEILRMEKIITYIPYLHTAPRKGRRILGMRGGGSFIFLFFWDGSGYIG